MARRISEQVIYTREDIERVMMSAAKQRIIDGFYIGTFHEQRTEWQTDGSLRVVTEHTQGSWDDKKAA